MYCEDCDSFLCNKCVIKNRQAHLPHKLEEISDLHRLANRDLLKCKQQMTHKNEIIEKQLAEIKEKMVSLKQNADDAENKLTEYFRLLLEQLRDCYVARSEQLRQNYFELLKRYNQMQEQQEFVTRAFKQLNKVDFLNSWEIFQKVSMQIDKQKMLVVPVESTSLLEKLDFKRHARSVFGTEWVGAQLTDGLHSFAPPSFDSKAFDDLSLDQLKERILQRGAQIIEEFMNCKANKKPEKKVPANVKPMKEMLLEVHDNLAKAISEQR